MVVNCPRCKDQRVFLSRHYFKTTPKYLLAVPNRFILEKWVPKKLNALIQITEHLNISDFLIHSAAPVGDKLEGVVSAPKWSQENVDMLVAMGFTANASKRALIKYQDNLEAASNWIMENMDNYEINKPFEEEQAPMAPSFNQEAVNQILDFGFSLEQAQVALLKNVRLFLVRNIVLRPQWSGYAATMATCPPSCTFFLQERNPNKHIITSTQRMWTTS